MSSTPRTQTPLDWKSTPPATTYRGLAMAFSAAFDAGVFTGRLNELMAAETYLSLVTPFLPDEQSDTQPRITLCARKDLKALAKK